MQEKSSTDEYVDRGPVKVEERNLRDTAERLGYVEGRRVA